MQIDNAIFYFFDIFSKNSKWKQHFYTKTSPKYLLLNIAVCWGCISRRERSRSREGALVKNLGSHRWQDVEKLTVPGSCNLNLSFSGVQKKKFFVKKMKEKRVTFCFIKLNANRFLNIISDKQLYNKKYHQKINHF